MKRLFVGFAVAFCMFQNAAHAQLGERSATQSQVANSIPAGTAPYTQPLCPTGTAGSAGVCAIVSAPTINLATTSGYLTLNGAQYLGPLSATTSPILSPETANAPLTGSAYISEPLNQGYSATAVIFC